MAYQHFNSGFHVCSKFSIDDRFVLTKAEMLSESIIIDDEEIALAMPDNYFTICSDDGKIYTYDRNNTFDHETGRFRVLESAQAQWGNFVDNESSGGNNNG